MARVYVALLKVGLSFETPVPRMVTAPISLKIEVRNMEYMCSSISLLAMIFKDKKYFCYVIALEFGTEILPWLTSLPNC